MAEDIDVIYTNIESMTRNTSGRALGEDTRYVKYFPFKLSYAGSNIVVSKLNVNKSLSQYQESIIRVTLDETFYDEITTNLDGYTVVMFVSGPTNTDPGVNDDAVSNDTYQDKFEYKIHLKPVYGMKGVFEVHINELLGRQMHIGVNNTIKFVFMVIAHNKATDLFENKYMTLLPGNAPIDLQVYKTNADYSNRVDDLMNAFIAIQELKGSGV